MIAVLQVFKGMEGNYIHIYSPPNPDDGFFSFAGLLVTQASHQIPRMKRWSLDALVTPRWSTFWWKGPPTELEAGPAGDSTEGIADLIYGISM